MTDHTPADGMIRDAWVMDYATEAGHRMRIRLDFDPDTPAEDRDKAIAAFRDPSAPATRHTPPTEPFDLDAIEARANAATDGPWGFYDGDNYADVAADLTMTSRASYSYREKIAQLEDENYWDDPAHEDDDESRAPEQMAANAAFIAHARTDVPALVDEVRRLRAELIAEQSQHLFTLRQRNLRSRRLLHLRDLALAGDTEALTAAAKDVLAASVDDHKRGPAAVPAAVETGE
jgi:hypothetical protein